MNFFPIFNITYSNSNHTVTNTHSLASSEADVKSVVNEPSPSIIIAKTARDINYKPVKTYDDKFHNKTWILYETSKDLMFCKFCTKNNIHPKYKQSPWANGRKTAGIDNMLKHEKSSFHKNSLLIPSIKAKNDEIFNKALEKEYHELLPLMTSSYWLATSYNAAIQIEGLSNLFAANNGKLPENYCNDKGVATIQRCISESIQKALIKLINDNNLFFSILIDESTDISVSKHLIVYVKYLDNWEPKTSFLGLVRVDSCDAASITKSLIGYLMKKDLNLKLMYGFTSDGASVMLGNANGVATRLKQEINALILNIHCVAHRIELAAVHSAEISELVEHGKTINEIYTFFHISSKRRILLEEACKQISAANPNIKPIKCLMPKQISTTRWLSLHDSAQILLQIYPAVIIVINTIILFEKNKKAARLLTEFRDKIKNAKFIAGLFLFNHYLVPVKFMCTNFQKEDISLARMIELVKSSVFQLKNLKSIELDEHLNEWKLRIENGYDPLFKLYKHCNLIGCTAEVFESIKLLAMQYKNELIGQIEQYFPNSEILSALTIFDVKGWPVIKNSYLNPQAELADSDLNYGDLSLRTLASFFRLIVNTDEIFTEWINFKSIIRQSFIPANKKEYLQLTNSKIYRHIYSEYSDTFPNILKLANIYLTVAVSSASCERGFSIQNLLKTPLRNRMTTPTLDSCIRIVSHRIPVNEFDFRDAYTIWKLLDSKQSILSSNFDDFIFSEAQQEQLESIVHSEEDTVLDFKINAEDVTFSPSVKDLIAAKLDIINNNVAPIESIIEPIEDNNNNNNNMEIDSNISINIIPPPSELIPPPPLDPINNEPVSPSNSRPKRQRRGNSKYASTP